MVQSKDVNQYLFQIRSHLKCPRKVKKDILQKIEADMQIALDDGDGSVSSLASAFGSPEEIANSYLLSLDQDDLRREIKKAKFWRTLLAILLALALVSFSIFMFALNEAGKHRTTHYTEDDVGIVGEE